MYTLKVHLNEADVDGEILGSPYQDMLDVFDSLMEGMATLLDLPFIGQIEGTYVTKSGNKVHILMDSPA